MIRKCTATSSGRSTCWPHGSCVGLLLGIPLHQFIIRTVEMDQLMFIRTIAPHSYLLSVALTMIFTLVVCFVMRRHVKKISMVESMKAPE